MEKCGRFLVKKRRKKTEKRDKKRVKKMGYWERRRQRVGTKPAKNKVIKLGKGYYEAYCKLHKCRTIHILHKDYDGEIVCTKDGAMCPRIKLEEKK